MIMSNESEARANPRASGQPRIYQAIADCRAFYPDPISIDVGEIVDIREKVDD